MNTHPPRNALHLILPVALVLGLIAAPATARPLVIAHRGASGYLPEHTLEAYAMAHAMGVDMIEPDLVATRDGHLVCMHDLTLEDTTDVEQRFPSRARDDGKWYVIDFDLDELKTLTKHGRDTHDHGYHIATLDEMLAMIARLNDRTGRAIGVAPEIKSPAFHARHGIDLPALAVSALAAHGYSTRDHKVLLQCFELDALRRVRDELKSDLPLLFLSGQPIDDATLDDLATWCDAVGFSRRVLEPESKGDPAFIERAQRRGLEVIVYTLKNEPEAIVRLAELGVDGLFADYPDVALRAVR